MNATEAQIEKLVRAAVESEGCELWGVEYLSYGKHRKLRLYIDRREEGVAVDDCERVSRLVSDLLDVEDLITDRYTLEVSSPGMDRILFNPEQYQDYIGHQVDVRLRYPFEGRKKFVGVLAGLENDDVIVQVGEDEYLLPLDSVQRTRIVPQFD